MDISLIEVPTFFGCDNKGVELAYKKLREKDILGVLSKHSLKVYDHDYIYVKNIPEEEKYKHHSTMKYLGPVVEFSRDLAHRVYSSLCAGSFPLIIGGDHSIGIGSISGASKYYKNLAVIWMDAHGDINTHETSPTGNIHGMPLAAAMGIGHGNLTDIYYSGQKVKPENVFLIGQRDLDEGERELVKAHNITVYSTEDVRKLGVNRIMEEIHCKLTNNAVDAVHLSFDVDCIDMDLVPGTGTPVKDGMSIEEVKYVLKYLMKTNLVKSMDLAELNPRLDKNDITADLCIDLIDWTFSHLKQQSKYHMLDRDNLEKWAILS